MAGDGEKRRPTTRFELPLTAKRKPMQYMKHKTSMLRASATKKENAAALDNTSRWTTTESSSSMHTCAAAWITYRKPFSIYILSTVELSVDSQT